MIRNKKILIFLLIISITFFGRINKVSARDDISCTYTLPFTGISPTSGKYMKLDSSFPCYSTASDSSYIDCSVSSVIETSDVALDSTYTGASVFGIKILGQNDILVATYNEFYGYGNHNSDQSKLLIGATDKALNCNSDWGSTSGCVNLHSDFDDPTKSDGHVHIKSTDGKCPKYIIIKMPNSTLIDEYKTLLYDATEDQRGAISFDHEYYGSSASELGDAEVIAYQVSDDDSVFKNSLNNFNNIPTESVDSNSFKIKGTINDETLYKNTVLALSGTAGKVDATENSKRIEHTTGIYRDVIIKAWIDLINKQLSGMKSNCGDDFGKYINLNNYKDDVPTASESSSKSYAFVKYATNGTNYNDKKLTKNDQNISSTCWNQRADYLRAYNTFRAFMYSIGATTNGEVDFEVDSSTNNVFAKAILKDNDIKNASNNIVFDWDSMVCFFKFVRYGTDDDNFSKCTSGNAAVEEKKECSQKVSSTQFLTETFNGDKCSYLCFSDVSSEENVKYSNLNNKYNNCKNNNVAYKNCVTSMSECGGSTSTSYKEICKNRAGCDSCTAYTECVKSYESKMIETSFESCMNEKVSGFSEKSSKAAEDAEKAYGDAISCYVVTETFEFEDAGLLRFDYEFKKYIPKCSDIKVFTGMYNTLIILAPFILLIYASYDYFKAVSGGDEEKIKQAKKKAPKRIIAFVLLLVFPVILRWYVSTFGTNRANNTKYIKCVITNDKGENESSED